MLIHIFIKNITFYSITVISRHFRGTFPPENDFENNVFSKYTFRSIYDANIKVETFL